MRGKGKALPGKKNEDNKLSKVQKTKVERCYPNGLKSVTEVGRGLLLGRELTPSGSLWTTLLHGVPTWHTLGVVPGFPPKEGLSVLTEAEAIKKAKAWRRSLAHKPWLGENPPTVQPAVIAYILIAAADDACKYSRLWVRAQNILHWLADAPLQDLSQDLLQDRFRNWVARLLLMPKAGQDMTIPRPDGIDPIDYDSPGFMHRVKAANRVILLFRASLDLAMRNQWIESDEAWRSLKPFEFRRDGTALLASERARLERLLAHYRQALSPWGKRMLFTGLRLGRDRLPDRPNFSPLGPQVARIEEGARS